MSRLVRFPVNFEHSKYILLLLDDTSLAQIQDTCLSQIPHCPFVVRFDGLQPDFMLPWPVEFSKGQISQAGITWNRLPGEQFAFKSTVIQRVQLSPSINGPIIWLNASGEVQSKLVPYRHLAKGVLRIAHAPESQLLMFIYESEFVRYEYTLTPIWVVEW
jgi:hypothetical protein